VGKVDQIGLRRLGKGRRRIAGGGQIDTADVQPLQHLRTGGEFDPADGNALFFQALIQGAAILQQREDIRLLIADVDGFRRFGQRGGRGRRGPAARRGGIGWTLSVLLSGFA
jgi:hypothetical protein